jgi:hypothetical protein
MDDQGRQCSSREARRLTAFADGGWQRREIKRRSIYLTVSQRF